MRVVRVVHPNIYFLSKNATFTDALKKDQLLYMEPIILDHIVYRLYTKDRLWIGDVDNDLYTWVTCLLFVDNVEDIRKRHG